MNLHEISSIGCLHNADRSICLTVAVRGQVQPVFVTISKAEFDNAGGIQGINANKQQAIDFYRKYGAGRP